jgi:flagellar motor switch protein FliM
MAEKALTKPEIAAQKIVIKLPPALGDWTTYRPAKSLVKKVKTGLYGFDRLSKKELNQTLLIHYRFIQDLFRSFKIDLAMGVELISCQVEQTTYLNFLRSLAGPVAQGKIMVPETHESIQVFFDLNLAHSLINHALGSHDLELLNRGFTEAETSVFSTTLNEYLQVLLKAFSGALTKADYQFLSAPDITFDPSINTSSSFVSFSCEVMINENPPGKITLGYVASSLKKIILRYFEMEKKKNLDFSRLPPSLLNQILISFTTFLGETTLLTSELKSLEVGDVVSVDSLINLPLRATIGNFLNLQVQPGIKNKKKAVRITSLKEEKIEVAPPLAEEKPAPAPPSEERLEITPEIKPLAEAAKEELEKEEFGLGEEFPGEEFPEEEFPEEEFPEEEFPEEKTSGEEFLNEEEKYGS